MFRLRSTPIRSFADSISRLSFGTSGEVDKIMESVRVSSVINQVDASFDGSDAHRGQSQRKLKLNKSLRRPAKVVLDQASKGLHESMGQELADCMNDYLFNNSIVRSNRRIVDSSEHLVEISTVSLNQDESHAHAFYTSEPFEAILQLMIKESGSGEHVDSSKNFQLAKRMEKNLTKKLAVLEGKFRSHIIRTINLRRVPRIFFAPDSSTRALLRQLEAIADLKSC